MNARAAWLCLWLPACAAGPQKTLEGRSFRLDEVDQIPLSSLDLAVVVSEPTESGPTGIMAEGFGPPVRGEPLFRSPRARHQELEAALFTAIRAHLITAGFQVKGLAPLDLLATATATTTASSSVTLAQILEASAADALLVVRAIPIDRFYVEEGAGTRTELTPAGRQTVIDRRPVEREGRLFLGQAFLFDRASGLRLWSKQAPDFPDAGRIVSGHPFLGYGVLVPKGVVPPGTKTLTFASSFAFASRILADFPVAKVGSATARAALDLRSSGAQDAEESFFDEGHLLLELRGGYGAESSRLELSFFDAKVDALGPAELSPAGIFRLRPTAAYMWPGGLFVSASLPVGLAPQSFGRTYYRDNPMPTITQPESHAAEVSLGGLSTIGAEASVGDWLAVGGGSSLFLAPEAGVFAEAWSIDTTSVPIVSDAERFRLGLILRVDLIVRSSADAPWYMRGGAEARLGVDFDAPVIIGLGVNLGVGVLL